MITEVHERRLVSIRTMEAASTRTSSFRNKEKITNPPVTIRAL
jgi:hypothetical protein